MHGQKVWPFLFFSKFAKFEKNRRHSFFGDFISKNKGMSRESSCFTKKSYGIEILAVHFSSFWVSKDVKYFKMCWISAKISAINLKQQGAISLEDKIKAILRRYIEARINFLHKFQYLLKAISMDFHPTKYRFWPVSYLQPRSQIVVTPC